MSSYKNQNTELDKNIARLELEKKIKFKELKGQLEVTSQSLKPVNIIKETFQDFKDSSEMKSNLLQTVASIAGGYV